MDLAATPSAFHQVPSELWTKIFLDCLPNRRFIEPNSETAPLILCNICRRWRSVAKSTSKLWSSIHVEVSLGSDIRKVVKGVALWLSLSGTRPLAISFTWNGKPQVFALRVAELPEWMKPAPLLELFVLAIARWETIKLNLIGRFENSMLPLFEGKHSPILQSFELSLTPDVPYLYTDSESDFKFFPVLAMLGASPRLRKVIWNSDRPGHRLPIETTPPLPWSQLSRFETHNGVTLAEFFHILQQSPNLTNGIFEIWDEDVPMQFLTTPMVHENLLDLDLCIQAEAIPSLLEYITLPTLRNLAIRGISDFDFWPQTEFVAFLSRLRSPLQRLKLSGTSIESSELIEILYLTPALKNLYVEGWSSTFLGDEFFQALTLHTDNQEGYLHLCPRLETLTLRATFTSSEGVLADMVASRCCLDVQGFTKLQRVDVTLTWDWVETCDHKRLEALCGKGLVFFVGAHAGTTAWDEDQEGDKI